MTLGQSKRSWGEPKGRKVEVFNGEKVSFVYRRPILKTVNRRGRLSKGNINFNDSRDNVISKEKRLHRKPKRVGLSEFQSARLTW